MIKLTIYHNIEKLSNLSSFIFVSDFGADFGKLQANWNKTIWEWKQIQSIDTIKSILKLVQD